jgi:hypothetical protein
VPGPAGLLPDLHVFSSLINALSDSSQTPDLAKVWAQMSKSPTNPLHGISFAKIPSDGTQLDGSKWDTLTFVEKKALHYSPSKYLKEG